MPLDLDPKALAALRLFPKLLPVLTEAIHALQKDSPGGRAITPDEWKQIGRAAGIFRDPEVFADLEVALSPAASGRGKKK